MIKPIKFYNLLFFTSFILGFWSTLRPHASSDLKFAYIGGAVFILVALILLALVSINHVKQSPELRKLIVILNILIGVILIVTFFPAIKYNLSHADFGIIIHFFRFFIVGLSTLVLISFYRAGEKAQTLKNTPVSTGKGFLLTAKITQNFSTLLLALYCLLLLTTGKDLIRSNDGWVGIFIFIVGLLLLDLLFLFLAKKQKFLIQQNNIFYFKIHKWLFAYNILSIFLILLLILFITISILD
jgi:hypothetical protein